MSEPDQPEPKFWDKEDVCVSYGLEICPDPVPLESLCGTYRWVYRNDDMMGNDEYRYDSAPPPEATYSGYPGSITLSFPSGKAHIPKNLTGSLRLIDLKGTFTGVKQMDGDVEEMEDDDEETEDDDEDIEDDDEEIEDDDEEIEDDDESYVNYWKIGRVDWEKSRCAEEEDSEGHALEIYNLKDDDGNRFIAFVWNQGCWGCEEHLSYCVAKKQKDENTFVGLTDAERDRMGMYLTEDEVSHRAFAKKSKEKTDTGQGKAEQDKKRKLDDESEENNGQQQPQKRKSSHKVWRM